MYFAFHAPRSSRYRFSVARMPRITAGTTESAVHQELISAPLGGSVDGSFLPAT
jgi:hypothetical protein